MATASRRLFHSAMVRVNNINNRKLLERFWKLKALHILKKNMAKTREEGLLPVLGPVEARACQRNRSWTGGDFCSGSPMLGCAANQHLADHS